MTNESFQDRLQRIHDARPGLNDCATYGPQSSSVITMDFVMKKMLMAAGAGISLFAAVIMSANYFPIV